MKKLYLFISMLLLNIGWQPVIAQFAGGAGIKDDPYIITTWQHLDNVRNYLDKHFKLNNDLDFDNPAHYGGYVKPAEGWLPIGNRDAFSGFFDGSGYNIHNLIIDRAGRNIGLFSWVTGTITRLHTKGGSVKGDYNVGFIVGLLDGASIEDCSNSGEVICEGSGGGIVGACGDSYDGPVNKITYCFNSGKISGNGDIGGIAGNLHGVIHRCANYGEVIGNSNETYNVGIGGITGFLISGSIEDCYNSGEITATGEYCLAGGIAGWYYYSVDYIGYCYNSGKIQCEVGGNIVGYDREYGENCYFLEGSCPQDNNPKRSLSDAAMRQQNSFMGFDFEYVWEMPVNGYPQLRKNGLSSGTADNPYRIYTSNDLRAIPDNSSAHYILCNDLALHLYYADEMFMTNFKGSFNGQNKTIEILCEKGRFGERLFDKMRGGLFDKVQGQDGQIVIQNLNVVSSYTTSGQNGEIYAGGIVNYLVSGIIKNCTFTGDIYYPGLMEDGMICHTHQAYIGGIVGFNENGSIISCSHKGNIVSDIQIYDNYDSPGNSDDCHGYDAYTAIEAYVGGIVGYSNGPVVNCTNQGGFENKNQVVIYGCENNNCRTEDNSKYGNIAGYIKGETKEVSIIGLKIVSKQYDGTKTAAIVDKGVLSGVVSGDEVMIDIDQAVANFVDVHVGTDKKTDITGIRLTGKDAAKYTLTQPSGVKADITKAELILTGITIYNKIYDGTVKAIINKPGILSGIIGGDDVSVDVTNSKAEFENANVGENKPVSVTLVVLSGNHAGNYNLKEWPVTHTASVTPHIVTVTGITIKEKVYDGTLSAEIDRPGTLSWKASGDDVSPDMSVAVAIFISAHAGNQQITMTGITLTGGSAANYMLWQPSDIWGVIVRAVPEIIVPPTVIPIAEGQMLHRAVFTGGKISVPGHFVFDQPDQQPAVGTLAHTAWFIPDNSNYESVSFNVNVSVIAMPYIITAQANKLMYASGEQAVISGKVVASGVQSVSGITVDVHVDMTGYRRTVTATTDASGNFSAVFTPQSDEAGHYYVICNVRNELSDIVNCEFDIIGMRLATSDWISWLVEQGKTKTGSIIIQNRTGEELNNLTVEIVSGTPNAEIVFEPLATLPGNGTVAVNYTITGVNQTVEAGAAPYWEELQLKAVSAEGAVCAFSALFYCSAPKAALEAIPGNINTTMVRGKAKTIEIALVNNGEGATGAIAVSIPQTRWMKLSTMRTMPSLAPGDTTIVSLNLIADGSVELGPYKGNITVNCTNGTNVSVPFNIKAVSENTGKLIVDVVDEYYHNTSAQQHLAGATVTVKDHYSGETVAGGFTGTDGLFVADKLPEGYYELHVSAEKHDSRTATIMVDAGKDNLQQIFISFQAITISWDVVPTEIEDNYEVEFNSIFETNVPKPVVILNMPDKMPALSDDETYAFEAKVTNHGWIAALGVEIIFPEDNEYEFVYLIDKFDLAPKSTRVFPVVMQRKNSGGNSPTPRMMAATQSLSAAGSKCVDAVQIGYRYICGPETNYQWEIRPFTYKERICSTGELTSEISRISQQRQQTPSRPCLNCGGGIAGGGGGTGTVSRPASPAITKVITYCDNGNSGNGDGGDGDCQGQGLSCDDTNSENFDLRFKLYAVPNNINVFNKEKTEVKGVAADGTSKIKIVFDKKNSKLPDCDCEYEYEFTFLSEGKGKWDKREMTYTAPSEFWETNSRTCSEFIKVIVKYNDQIIYEKEDAIEIQIVRVPVLMVHGLNSEPKKWNDLCKKLDKSSYNKWQLHKVDYSSTHNDSFETNKRVVGTDAYNLLNQCLHNEFLASKVDVVAHSMGGLLTKLYIQKFSDNKPWFRKIITLNTPHGGSQLGNLMTDSVTVFLRNIQDRYNPYEGLLTPYYVERTALRGLDSIFNPNSGRIENPDRSSAVRDLSVGGIAIQKLNNNVDTKGIKCHAIVSTIGNEVGQFLAHETTTYILTQGGEGAYFSPIAILLGFPHESYWNDNHLNRMLDMLYNNGRSDLIVQEESQRGGLNGEHISTFNGTDYSRGGLLKTVHTKTTDNSDILLRIEQLLKMSEKAPDFADGFGKVDDVRYTFEPQYCICDTFTNINSILPKPCDKSTLCINTPMQRMQVESSSLDAFPESMTSETVSITANYTVGDTVLYVTVNHTEGITNISTLSTFRNDIVSFRYGSNDTIYIPAKTRGNITILASGKTPDNYYLMDSVTVYVDNILNQMPVSLQFDEISDTLYLFKSQ